MKRIKVRKHFQTPVYETDFILGPNRKYVFLSKSLFIVGSKVGNWDAETVKFRDGMPMDAWPYLTQIIIYVLCIGLFSMSSFEHWEVEIKLIETHIIGLDRHYRGGCVIFPAQFSRVSAWQ